MIRIKEYNGYGRPVYQSEWKRPDFTQEREVWRVIRNRGTTTWEVIYVVTKYAVIIIITFKWIRIVRYHFRKPKEGRRIIEIHPREAHRHLVDPSGGQD